MNNPIVLFLEHLAEPGGCSCYLVHLCFFSPLCQVVTPAEKRKRDYYNLSLFPQVFSAAVSKNLKSVVGKLTKHPKNAVHLGFFSSSWLLKWNLRDFKELVSGIIMDEGLRMFSICPWEHAGNIKDLFQPSELSQMSKERIPQ